MSGRAGHEPDLKAAVAAARRVSFAMAELKAVAPDAGSYVAESNYFEPRWQRSYWGANYRRLQRIKRKYDPQCLFYVHHGVGTEQCWKAASTPLSSRRTTFVEGQPLRSSVRPLCKPRCFKTLNPPAPNARSAFRSSSRSCY